MPAPLSPKDLLEIYEKLEIGVAIVGEDGRWLNVNDTFCDIVRYSRPELLRRTFQDITHPEDIDDNLTLVGECLTGEREHYALVKRYIPKFGHPVWVTLVVNVVRNDTGQFEHFIAQVIPLSNGDTKTYFEKEKDTIMITHESGKKFTVKFLENNWQWFVGAAVAINTAVLGFLVDLRDTTATIKNNSEQIEQLKEQIQQLKNIDLN